MIFRNEYWFLSNMYPVKILYRGLTFNCVEAAFQAEKCVNPEDKKRFVNLDGFEAKKLGRTVKLISTWNEERVFIMYRLLKIKFSNPDLKRMLKNIECDIVEENTWNDKFWGVCRGAGENMLGKLLMKIRKEI